MVTMQHTVILVHESYVYMSTVRDGDLRVVLDVTKVVDAETAKAGNRTPDLSHRKHTLYH